MIDRKIDRKLKQELPDCVPEVEELPLKVVPDWDAQVTRAIDACRLIDRHLDYEARGRLLMHLQDFRPQHLCPEQRVQVVTDLYAVTR